MFKKMKQQAIKAWEVEDKRREQAREIRGIKFVPEEEVDDYTKILAEVRIKLALPDVPSMPVLSRGEQQKHTSQASNLKKASKIAEGKPSTQSTKKTLPT